MADSCPSIILFELHGKILRTLSHAADRHFAGLQQAARYPRKTKIVDDRMAKHLCQLDAAYNITRHLTRVGAREFAESVVRQLHEQPCAHRAAETDPSLVPEGIAAAAAPAPHEEKAVILEEVVNQASEICTVSNYVDQYFKYTRGNLCSKVPTSVTEAFGNGDQAKQEAICRQVGALLEANFNSVGKELNIPETGMARAITMVSQRSLAEARQMLTFWHDARMHPTVQGEEKPKRNKLRAVTQR